MRVFLFASAVIGIAIILFLGQAEPAAHVIPSRSVCPPSVDTHHLPVVVGYIDPGTASLIFQTLLAGLLGILVAVKRIRDYVTGFFIKIFGRNRQQGGAETGDAGEPAEPQTVQPCPSAGADAEPDKAKTA